MDELHQLESILWHEYRCSIDHGDNHSTAERIATANKVLGQFQEMRKQRRQQLANLQSLFSI